MSSLAVWGVHAMPHRASACVKAYPRLANSVPRILTLQMTRLYTSSDESIIFVYTNNHGRGAAPRLAHLRLREGFWQRGGEGDVFCVRAPPCDAHTQTHNFPRRHTDVDARAVARRQRAVRALQFAPPRGRHAGRATRCRVPVRCEETRRPGSRAAGRGLAERVACVSARLATQLAHPDP